MTFLQPLLLFGLPLALLPVIIHLIHLHRRRTVPWAAMMFLLAAQRMNKGFSKLRQWLILLFRVLAVLAILLAVSRPLAGGWLGLTGGVPDTVLILLDRSASMSQQTLATGTSKRSAALRNLTQAIKDTYGKRSHLVLLDSATVTPTPLERADALLDLPQTTQTDTAADIPAMLQGALDYITANQTGRTDVWVLSDLQATDWNASGGRWDALRGAFATLRGVRFHLLCYPQTAPSNLAITVERAVRREVSGKAELLLDLRVTRNETNPQPLELPLRIVVNGTASTLNATIKDNQLLLQAQAIPIDKTTKRGWGRVELPADANPLDNVNHFVFDEPSVMQSVIVSDDASESSPMQAALSAPADPTWKYAATVLPSARAAEIPWEETALIIWHAAIPAQGEGIANQLESHVAAGRTVIFLPPNQPTDATLFGLRWGVWVPAAAGKPFSVEWWRNDTGLLANTRDGLALPLGELEVARQCEVVGDGAPLARTSGNKALLVRAAGDHDGGAYFLGTLSAPDASSLARDGVVLFATLHRALNEGSKGLGKAQQRFAARAALGTDVSIWKPSDTKAETVIAAELPFKAGVLTAGEKLVALNRPPGEDSTQVLARSSVEELFAGLDFRYLEDKLESGKNLTSEVWRTFLIAMALALLSEALLCMPPLREPAKEERSIA
jgi:hypothetical protein